jgi:hypothetical protein
MIQSIKKTKKWWFYHPYTRGLMRWGLISFGLAVTGISIGYMLKNRKDDLAPASMGIERPDFYSISPHGHPYHIHAESIEHKKSGQFVFFQPWARYDWFAQKLNLRSEKGYWNDTIQMLTLEKNVRIYDDQETRLYTQCVQILYQNKEIHSQTKTTGSSRHGQFQSRGFSWTKQALRLHGPVTMTLNTIGPGGKTRQHQHKNVPYSPFQNTPHHRSS